MLRRWLLTLLGGVPAAEAEPTGAGDDKAAEEPGDARAPAAPRAAVPDPFANRNQRTLQTLTWLVGALAAVASLMVAGSQLSSLGQLTSGEDRDRLLLAAGSAGLAVALVVTAVGLLAWAQLPGPVVDVTRLRDIASTPDPKGAEKLLVEGVAADSSYHRGTASLDRLLGEVDRSTAEYFDVATRLRDIELRSVRAGDDDERSSLLAAADRLRTEQTIRQDEVVGYRRGLQGAAYLDAHLRLRHRARVAAGLVLVIATVVAVCLVTFAWAANPPPEEAEVDAAVPQRPVAGRLLLTSEDAVWADRLGAGCAAAARAGDGVAVVALGSDDESVTVLVPPGPECPAPVQVTVARDDGTVTADEDALARGASSEATGGVEG